LDKSRPTWAARLCRAIREAALRFQRPLLAALCVRPALCAKDGRGRSDISPRAMLGVYAGTPDFSAHPAKPALARVVTKQLFPNNPNRAGLYCAKAEIMYNVPTL